MKITLKRLSEQVVVIVGASSGIGLVTAKRAARRGASVALVARNADALDAAAEQIRRERGRALPIIADVSDPDALAAVGERVLREYGRVDTWVNGAAVAAYGRLCSSPLHEMRRQLDVNFWGQVYGSRVGVQCMRHSGGALINIGSGLSDRAMVLLGMYCAAKHAVKGYTDALRMELEKDRIPISVTLVKPSSINTPFYQKALTRLGAEPRPVPPVYTPEVVADTILAASERPVREIAVGGGAALMSMARFAPRLTDAVMERLLFNAQKSDTPADENRPHNLYAPLPDDGGERGRNWDGVTLKSSAYTSLMLHGRTAVLAVALAAIAASVANRRL